MGADETSASPATPSLQVFKYDRVHYLFASHLTGWDPNPPLLQRSSAGGMCSTFWIDLPRPTHGPEEDADYQSQVSLHWGCRGGSRV